MKTNQTDIIEEKIRTICTTKKEHGGGYYNLSEEQFEKLFMLLTEVRQQDLKIGDLRQWLNEERITDTNKMVTDEEIEIMLALNPKKKVSTASVIPSSNRLVIPETGEETKHVEINGRKFKKIRPGFFMETAEKETTT